MPFLSAGGGFTSLRVWQNKNKCLVFNSGMARRKTDGVSEPGRAKFPVWHFPSFPI